MPLADLQRSLFVQSSDRPGGCRNRMWASTRLPYLASSLSSSPMEARVQGQWGCASMRRGGFSGWRRSVEPDGQTGGAFACSPGRHSYSKRRNSPQTTPTAQNKAKSRTGQLRPGQFIPRYTFYLKNRTQIPFSRMVKTGEQKSDKTKRPKLLHTTPMSSKGDDNTLDQTVLEPLFATQSCVGMVLYRGIVVEEAYNWRSIPYLMSWYLSRL